MDAKHELFALLAEMPEAADRLLIAACEGQIDGTLSNTTCIYGRALGLTREGLHVGSIEAVQALRRQVTSFSSYSNLEVYAEHFHLGEVGIYADQLVDWILEWQTEGAHA